MLAIEVLLLIIYCFMWLSQDIIHDSAEVITSSFPRLHAMVIGPGLGRHPDVQLMIQAVLQEAVSKDIG